MKTRRLLALVLAMLAPSLACDTKLDPATANAFAAQGLRIQETHLLRFPDGTTLDRRHEGRHALRARSRRARAGAHDGREPHPARDAHEVAG